MFQMYCDGYLLYDLRQPEYALAEPKCELVVNKTGSLSFKIAPGHPHYRDIQKMKSEISLYQNGEWIFSGRVLNDESDFNNIKSIQCEGELSYLLDSNQRIAEYHDLSVADYFKILIEKHNADVEETKQFTCGLVTVTDPNDSLYRFSNYENTWETMEDKLLDRLGGYIRSRHQDGYRYLDYVADYGNVNSQLIEFGENLLDLSKEVKGEDLATVIIPLGAKIEDSDERLTITSINDGKDYVEDQEAVSIYGRIVRTVEFDDVTLESNLLRKGYEQLAMQKLLSVTLTLTAVDLHLLSVEIERIKIGDMIRVLSKPHGLDQYLMVQKLAIDLASPEKSKITLGATVKTLSDAMQSGQKEAWEEILGEQKSIKEKVSSVGIELEECYSEISKTAEEIKLVVEENYLSKSDLETIQQDFETSITQSATEITMHFSTITNEIKDLVSTNQTTLQEYIRFKGALIELGKIGNAFTAELSNEELAFKENGQKIAYISNQNLVITNTEIRNKLSLGHEERGWFDFIPRINGNLSIKWRDPIA